MMIITEFVDQKIHGTSFSTESYGCLLKKNNRVVGCWIFVTNMAMDQYLLIPFLVG